MPAAGRGHISDQPKRVRTCIACGARSTKGGMVRVVRMPNGAIVLDEKGRAAGRGAYVCSQACFEKACATHRFDRALKTNITAEDYERLSHEASNLFEVQEV